MNTLHITEHLGDPVKSLWFQPETEICLANNPSPGDDWDTAGIDAIIGKECIKCMGGWLKVSVSGSH